MNCYARTWHSRFAKHMGIEPWGAPHFLAENLDMPLFTKTPRRVFVAPMSDLGHELVKPEWLASIARIMRLAPWHTYIVLTKRPGLWLREIPTETWVGVTIESTWAIHRWATLCVCAWPEVRKFVSVEPMLGPVSFGAWAPEVAPDWVIAGPETGRKARPCDDAWIDALSRESKCFFDKRETWKRREFPKMEVKTCV